LVGGIAYTEASAGIGALLTAVTGAVIEAYGLASSEPRIGQPCPNSHPESPALDRVPPGHANDLRALELRAFLVTDVCILSDPNQHGAERVPVYLNEMNDFCFRNLDAVR
jgi:hypothetical protein